MNTWSLGALALIQSVSGVRCNEKKSNDSRNNLDYLLNKQETVGMSLWSPQDQPI